MERHGTLLTKNVFVVGRQPDVTYNPRDEHHLEREVRAYLTQGPGRALSVSGPTKSGKTVLVERLLPQDEAIWMQGSDIRSVHVLWNAIVDWLGLYDQVEHVTDSGASDGARLTGNLGLHGVASVSGSLSEGTAESSSMRTSRQLAITTVARDGLKTLALPIVIDDFHYIADETKQEIARAIKTVIPSTPVVMIAVPHEAFDIIRGETDLGGRITQLKIEPWSVGELEYISRRGFEALAISDGEAVGRRLAENSFGAPFLMQELCFEYATSINVLQTAEPEVAAVAPDSWEDFFRRVANRKPPMIFNELLKGPKTRGQERIDRVFRAGWKTDIYGALLYAISKIGPRASLRYQDIARVLERELVEPVSGQQIAASLRHMSTIAMEHRGTGDPAVAYKNDELYILDPFLAFYLRFGDWDVAK